MYIVIDIPEESYDFIKRTSYHTRSLYEAIKNGTPLPKGHGRLIILSEDEIKREQTPLSFSCQKWVSEVGLSNATLAIIEADKEESEVKEAIEMSKVDVFDKMRAEIVDCLKALDDIEKSGFNIYLPNEISGRRLTYHQCLEIIDKYRTESEGE